MDDESKVAEAEFAVESSAPRLARLWVAGQLEPLRLSAAQTNDALLLVSELVTNVIVHTESPPTVTVAATADRVEIAVADRDGELAAVRDRSPDEIGGWGLRIVDEVASSWGARFPGGGVKVVWFAIDRDHADPPSIPT